jgi:hypothetical protein
LYVFAFCMFHCLIVDDTFMPLRGFFTVYLPHHNASRYRARWRAFVGVQQLIETNALS